MKRPPRASVGLLSALLLLLTLLFGYGAFACPHSAKTPSGAPLEAPSAAHVLGTDNLGIDIFAQLSRGFFPSMATGLAAAALVFLAGGALGGLAGCAGRKTDLAVSFGIQVFLSVPQLPALVVLGALWGQSRWNVILIVAAFSWAPIATQARAKTISIKGRPYIALAKSYGGKARYVIFRHMLPELLPLLLVSSLSVVGKAIVMESSLAYLGLSDPLAKSWGIMISRASSFPGIYFTDYWKWWLLSPITALVATVLLARLLAASLERAYLEGGA